MQTHLYKIRQKLYSRDAMHSQVKQWQAQGERVIFTNGCFDILHPGHIDYLAKAASLGQRLIIGLNADSSVSRLKGPHRPIQDENARSMLLSALGFVDGIVIFEGDTPFEVLSTLLPDVLVKGADYTIDQVVGADIIIKNGGSVVLLPYLRGYSTTGVERRIREAGDYNS